MVLVGPFVPVVVTHPYRVDLVPACFGWVAKVFKGVVFGFGDDRPDDRDEDPDNAAYGSYHGGFTWVDEVVSA